MGRLKATQESISAKGSGWFKTWIKSITIKRTDSISTILLKLLKAFIGTLVIIILSPILLFFLIITLAIAL